MKMTVLDKLCNLCKCPEIEALANSKIMIQSVGIYFNDSGSNLGYIDIEYITETDHYSLLEPAPVQTVTVEIEAMDLLLTLGNITSVSADGSDDPNWGGLQMNFDEYESARGKV